MDDFNYQMNEQNFRMGVTPACERCQRRYPDTIIDIESVMGHSRKEYFCINKKACDVEVERLNKMKQKKGIIE